VSWRFVVAEQDRCRWLGCCTDLCRAKLSIKAVELLFRVDWSGRPAVFVDGAAEDTSPPYGRVDRRDNARIARALVRAPRNTENLTRPDHETPSSVDLGRGRYV
jgi:hypothetical protein